MRILQFLEDDVGHLSSTRLVFTLWGFVVVFVWAATSLYQGAPQPIDEWVAAILGALMTGKVWQKFPEAKK